MTNQKQPGPVAHWKQVIRTAPGYGESATHMQLVAVLKEEHGLGGVVVQSEWRDGLASL